MGMIDDTGHFGQMDELAARLKETEGGFVVRIGEHVTLKGREFIVDSLTDETLTLRPVRQVSGGRTMPGPIPSQRVAPPA